MNQTALVSHLGPSIIRPCQKNLLLPGHISNSLILASSDWVDDGSIKVIFPYGISGDSRAFAFMLISAICLISTTKQFINDKSVDLIIKLYLKIHVNLINCEYLLFSLHRECVLLSHELSSVYAGKLLCWREMWYEFRASSYLMCRKVLPLASICVLRGGFKVQCVDSCG